MSHVATTALVLFLLPGCLASPEAPARGPGMASMARAAPTGVSTEGGLVRGAGGAGEADPGVFVERRLIRTGQLGVVVDAYPPFQRELDAWLSDAGGHVANASLQHADGEVSWGSLTVRVPEERLDGLVGWVEESVQVEQLSLVSQDVTAEWVDVEARIGNSRREESRLQELLGESTGSLSDVLAVERELARVRGDIESAEGQMRVLRDQVGLATLQLDVRVREPYAAGLVPTFGEDVARTFAASVAALGATARGAALLGVAVLPWASPPGVFVLGTIALVRRRRARRSATCGGSG